MTLLRGNDERLPVTVRPCMLDIICVSSGAPCAQPHKQPNTKKSKAPINNLSN